MARIECPCGACKWCRRCNRWVDLERVCLHLRSYRKVYTGDHVIVPREGGQYVDDQPNTPGA